MCLLAGVLAPALLDGTAASDARRTALAAWTGRDADAFEWVTAPVLNACTRLSVEMCPATGALTVAGWEADERGAAARVTAISAF